MLRSTHSLYIYRVSYNLVDTPELTPRYLFIEAMNTKHAIRKTRKLVGPITEDSYVERIRAQDLNKLSYLEAHKIKPTIVDSIPWSIFK